MNSIAGFPRVLLIAEYLPEGGAGGGVILRDLLKTVPAENICWFAMEGPVNYKPSWRPEIKREFIRFFWPGRFRYILDRIEYSAGGRFFHSYLQKKLTQIVKIFKPEIIWFVAQKRILPLASRMLKRFPDLPVHVSIHDDPLLENRYHANPIAETQLVSDLNMLLDRAGSMDAVSQRMLSKYIRSRQKGLVITRGIEQNLIDDQQNEPKTIADNVRIVMAGMGQCPPPWPNDLIDGIRLLQKKISQKVTFHAYDFTFPADGETFFREPFIKSEEFEQKIKTYHIGYICDPINDYGKEFARTSFSTKLVTYVTHGLPFLYHGPRDSTASDFLQNDVCGVVVESFSADIIAAGFFKVLQKYELYRLASLRAASNFFCSEAIRDRFATTITNVIHSKI